MEMNLYIQVNTPTKSRPSTSSSSHYDMSSQSISLPGSKTTLLVEDMEQDAERLPSLDILLKDLRNSLQEVVATTAPQNCEDFKMFWGNGLHNFST